MRNYKTVGKHQNMDYQFVLILSQDGIVNGAIYALLALALVLVFAVTRVIFIPQGVRRLWRSHPGGLSDRQDARYALAPSRRWPAGRVY